MKREQFGVVDAVGVEQLERGSGVRVEAAELDLEVPTFFFVGGKFDANVFRGGAAVGDFGGDRAERLVRFGEHRNDRPLRKRDDARDARQHAVGTAGIGRVFAVQVDRNARALDHANFQIAEAGVAAADIEKQRRHESAQRRFVELMRINAGAGLAVEVHDEFFFDAAVFRFVIEIDGRRNLLGRVGANDQIEVGSARHDALAVGKPVDREMRVARPKFVRAAEQAFDAEAK